MPKHFLSIAMIVRDEEDYIGETLEFHLLQGVEHFYITEHEPQGKLIPKLETYLEDGLVTYNTIRGPVPQPRAYQEVLDKYHGDTRWIAFIDADEFLYSAKGVSIPEVLRTLPEDCGAYAVHWVLYGSNGQVFKKKGLVTQRFVSRARTPDKHVKSIVNTACVTSYGKNPHCFPLAKGYALRGTDRTPLPEAYSVLSNPVEEPLRINHYHVKSQYEYKKRKLNPTPDSKNPLHLDRVDEMFRAHDVNEVRDVSACAWADIIEANLRARGLWHPTYG